jgi:hypothetical protein
MVDYTSLDFERLIMRIYNNAPKNLTVKWGKEELRDLESIQEKYNSV